MRILFHAINGVGLGHLTRVCALAREVRRLGHQPLVLTSAVDTSMLDRAGLDHVALAPRIFEPHASPARALEGLDEGLERAALAAVIDAWRPDLAVFDTHPPAWLVREVRGRGARAALVLRELRPERFEAFFRGELATAFDRVLIPHPGDEVDPGQIPWFTPAALLGPVLRELDAPGEGAAEAPGRPLLLVLAGGGGQPVDARRYLQAAVDAHWLLRLSFPGLCTALIQGPYGAAPARLPPGVLALGAVEAIAPWVRAADLVISQAGYNTVAELRALGAPAVLVPGQRRAEDQRARALRLERLGAAVVARPDASALADLVGGLLAEPARLARMREACRRHPQAPRNAEAAAWLVGERPRRERPRVVLVAPEFPPRVGGMETFAARLAAELSALCEVIVYTCDRPGVPEIEGVTIRKLYTSAGPPRAVDFWPDLLLTVAALGRDEPCAVLLCNAGLGAAAPALRAACPGAAVAAVVHGNDLLRPWVNLGVDEGEAASAAARGLAGASGVFAVSRCSAGLLAGVEARVIYSGVDEREGEREAGQGGPLVVTVARLAPRKGHATVLRAVALLRGRHPGLRFAFTGEGDAALAELSALAAELGAGDALLPLGRVDEGDLGALLRRASVFVLAPTEQEGDIEGFGLSALEAAAAGLPVITSSAGGAAEAAALIEADVVPPGDPVALARALDALLSDPDLAARRGERSRALARGLSWGSTARSYLDALVALRAGGRPAGGLWLPEASGAPPDERAARAMAAARASSDGPSLREAARVFAAEQRAAAEARRERYRAALAAGRQIRLRALGRGRELLSQALDDCAALGHRPAVDLPLDDWADPLLLRPLLPRVSRFFLVHTAPSRAPASLLARVERAAPAALALVGSVRLQASDEALLDEALWPGSSARSRG